MMLMLILIMLMVVTKTTIVNDVDDDGKYNDKMLKFITWLRHVQWQTSH